MPGRRLERSARSVELEVVPGARGEREMNRLMSNRWWGALVVAVELGDVIDLDRVGDSLSESGWSADALRLGR